VEYIYEGCRGFVKSVRKAHEQEERAYLGGKPGAEAVRRRAGPTGKPGRVIPRRMDWRLNGGHKPTADSRALTWRELREFKSGQDEAPSVAALRRRLQVLRARSRRFSMSCLQR
jgi:hypothetical protein